MIKNFFIFFTVILIFAGAYLYKDYASNKTLITPYPFSFSASAKRALDGELNLAESATILIVGDRMGQVLSQYTPQISEELAKKLKNPPKIYNWSKPHEGLHRTLFKLKSMKKLPPIIIYHVESSELYEKTFAVADKVAILKNFSLYDNENIISLIITFPWLSKIIYKKMNYIELGPLKEYINHLPSMEKLVEKEISFKFFDYELREMIDLIKDKKSNLVLITTPINLEIKPHETCAHSSSKDLVELQLTIEKIIEEGNFKKAYPMALELSNESYSNAQSFYLLGKSSMGLGDLAKARDAFQKAAIFDCSTWRGNAVYNAIMKSSAKKRQVPLIDFDQYMASALSKDGLFIDDLYPQNIFYQTMTTDLKENLNKILSIF